MPHVVVTGAGGFIGGFVARWLAGRGYDVTAVVRRPIGSAVSPGIRWLESDLRQAALPGSFDALVHCAAETPERVKDGDALYRSNHDASRNVFRQAVTARARCAVYLSSMAAYGKVDVPLVTEDLPPRELDPYGRAKRDAELMLETAVSGGVKSGLTIRLPGTVGKGSHSNFLSLALGRALRGETIEVRNPNAPFNNIVYIGDLAVFLEQWLGAPRPGYSVTNLAAAEPLPFREVFEVLFTGLGKSQNVVYSESGKAPFLIALDRALSLGYRPATVRASVGQFVRDSLCG